MALWFGTISFWNKTSGTQSSKALPGQEQYGDSNDVVQLWDKGFPRPCNED